MKYLFILLHLILLIWVEPANGRQLSVNVQPPGTQAAVFATPNGELSVAGNGLAFADQSFSAGQVWSASAHLNRVTILEKSGQAVAMLQFDDAGNQLYSTPLQYVLADDPTLNVYTFPDGRVVMRDNVANFSFFDAGGEMVYSVSNSSQSRSGERESELATDSHGITTVLYNPVISYGATTGSRAVLVYGEENTTEFFRSSDQEISFLKVTENGTLILLIAENEAGSEVHVYDRFGNHLYHLATDEKPAGAELTENGGYITLFTSGRVQVYNVATGERLGSASSANSILYAAYDESEHVMIALGGDLNGYSVSNPSIMLVDIQARSIARQEIDGSLYTLGLDDIYLVKTGDGQFTLNGLRERVEINY